MNVAGTFFVIGLYILKQSTKTVNIRYKLLKTIVKKIS